MKKIDEFLNEASEREFGDSASEIPYVELQDSNSAFGRHIREFEIINFGYKDFERFLLKAFELYNLYGYAMSQRLPIGEYQWLSESKIKQKFITLDQRKNVRSILNLKDDSNIGYIFDPTELHEKHNDFPFCAEKRTIPGIIRNKKLMLTFYDKKNYIVHYQMLKLALEHGLVLKKVHRVLQFKQSKWLEE